MHFELYDEEKHGPLDPETEAWADAALNAMVKASKVADTYQIWVGTSDRRDSST